jgi:hypothetical protein
MNGIKTVYQAQQGQAVSNHVHQTAAVIGDENRFRDANFILSN